MTSKPLMAEESRKGHWIRIAILNEQKDVLVSIRSHYQIINPLSGEVLVTGRRLKATRIIWNDQGIEFAGKVYPEERIRFVPKKDVTIQVRNQERRYRGMIDVIRKKEGHLIIVNTIELEDYIKGVLYHEVSHRWSMEALKVQAVCARTYALYQMKVNLKKDFDVTSDIYSQVYGGRNSERFRTNLAVEKTQGQILMYQDKILPTYYHATCGGYTEDVKELWEHDLAPLKGVRCDFCTHSPHYLWKRNFRSKDIQDQLNQLGYKIGLIKEIQIIEQNKSGRVKKLQILDRDGKAITISGKDFRSLVGPNHLKSNNYVVEMKGYYFNVIGKGWGHGVGMCQWGSFGMSTRQYKYKEILQYYYPGSYLVDLQTSQRLEL